MKDTNPKLTYYKLLYAFLSAPEFIKMVAQELVRQRHALGIGPSAPHHEVDEWEAIHQVVKGEKPSTDDKEDIMEGFLVDMHGQMRTEDARTLMFKLQSILGYSDGLLAYAKKVYPLGDGTATVTLFVSDWLRFQRVMNQGAHIDTLDFEGAVVTEFKDPSIVIFGHIIRSSAN